MRSNKYPKLIAYYRERGYEVNADSDLRDLHLHIPLDLYIKFMNKSFGRFDYERGRTSKAGVEALEAWVKDTADTEKINRKKRGQG